jgi:hypothetical protein
VPFRPATHCILGNGTPCYCGERVVSVASGICDRNWHELARQAVAFSCKIPVRRTTRLMS